jgi:16S rRNA (guanine966-N2)-methyltransferase
VRARLPEVLARVGRGRFALAFVDPPYADGPEAVLAALDGALASGGLAVTEHDARRPPDERYGGLRRVDARAYGGTGISIYRRE